MTCGLSPRSSDRTAEQHTVAVKIGRDSATADGWPKMLARSARIATKRVVNIPVQNCENPVHGSSRLRCFRFSFALGRDQASGSAGGLAKALVIA